MKGKEKIGHGILEKVMMYLLVIPCVVVGCVNIDLVSANRLEICLFRTKDGLNKVLAELTLRLIFAHYGESAPRTGRVPKLMEGEYWQVFGTQGGRFDRLSVYRCLC
jgi:lactate dehydrogenase-like 2-hydroxyacid dehydrogenase